MIEQRADVPFKQPEMEAIINRISNHNDATEKALANMRENLRRFHDWDQPPNQENALNKAKEATTTIERLWVQVRRMESSMEQLNLCLSHLKDAV